MMASKTALIGLLMLTGLATLAACGSTDGANSSANEEAPSSTEAKAADGSVLQPSPSESGIDVDPDQDADPNTLAAPDETTPPATQSELITRFAPHLQLYPTDYTRPANVDWFLSRVTMRFNHADCPDHEVLGLGKVTQASLIAQTHDDNKSFCRHDDSKNVPSTSSDHFFIQVADHATYNGAPRAEWKSYVVWRPQKTGGRGTGSGSGAAAANENGLVDIEYWFFYAFNDGFSIFDHEADWEHMKITIDPKGDNGQGKATTLMWSAHKGGTTLAATDPKIDWEDTTHPVSYVAKGSHANYPKPGTYAIPGTYIANDDAKASTVKWNIEDGYVLVGTRSAPKNNQIFIKYWGYWGSMGTLPETEGITRHFP